MESKTVEKDGHPVELTAKEYDLLLLFLRNRNIALYRERIYEEVWGGEFDPDSRTVDIHVQRLKRKMGVGAFHGICQKCGLQTGGVRDVKLWQRFCLWPLFLFPSNISWDRCSAD